MLTELLQVQIKDKREYIQIKMLYLVDRAFFSLFNLVEDG
jgi:hypothetical protein